MKEKLMNASKEQVVKVFEVFDSQRKAEYREKYPDTLNLKFAPTKKFLAIAVEDFAEVLLKWEEDGKCHTSKRKDKDGKTWINAWSIKPFPEKVKKEPRIAFALSDNNPLADLLK